MGVILFVVCLAIIVVSYLANRIDIEDISIEDWNVVDSSEDYNTYIGSVESDEKKPFVAVLGNYLDDEQSPELVYMEDGKGKIRTIEDSDDDPSTMYKPIGYLKGKKVSDSDIKNIDFTDKDYFDLEYSNETMCDLKIDIEMKSKKNGFLFVELQNEKTKEEYYNVCITIVNGVGEYTKFLSDLSYKSRGVKAKLVPKMFCESKRIHKSDYSVEEEFSVVQKDTDTDDDDYNYDYDDDDNKDEVAYEGRGIWKFKKVKNGFVVLTTKLVEGGRISERNELNRFNIDIHNNVCELKTYDSPEDKDKYISEPVYEIEFKGYIPIVPLDGADYWGESNKNVDVNEL